MDILSKFQVDKSVELLNKIRTDEGELFPLYVNGEDKNHSEFEYAFVKFFDDINNNGIFTSIIYYGLFRVFIAFENDTEKYVKELAELIYFVKEKFPNKILKVHFITYQYNLIKGIQKEFQFEPPYPNGFYYSSHEFTMDKEHFPEFNNYKIFEINKFEEDKVEEYTLLLDNAVDFVQPPTNFQKNKESFTNDVKKKDFFSFYINDDLIGIYWLDNDLYTIEYIAIASLHQRKGYGSIILSHSIDNVLYVHKHKMAKLYCVDWNKKGLEFYTNFGMVLKGRTFQMILK